MTAAIDGMVTSYLMRRRERTTATQYGAEARRFAAFAGKEMGFTRDDVIGYLDGNIDRGLNPRTIAWSYHVLKRVFRIIGEPFPIGADDLPRLDDTERMAPIMKPGDVRRLISIIREHGSPRERFYLLLSTLYGLRRIELARIEPGSFARDLGLVHIDTAKHGLKRDHLVPPEVRVYISRD